jgi:FKBP-type peptidyl-prolyl cis-trans isomerase FkpA
VRRYLIFFSLTLWAQTSLLPAQTSTTTPAKPAASTAKPSTTAAKPAVRKPVTPAKPAPMTEEQKTIYALGLSIAHSISRFDLSPAELDIVKKALTDAAANKPAVEIETYGPKIADLQKDRAARVAAKEKAESQAYLAKASAQPGVVKTDSGLLYKETQAGTGDSPKPADSVKVHYKGTLLDGSEFDSSYKRGQPAEFPLNGVIPCWTEGLQKMKVGGKATLVCPSNLAYGDAGNRGIPGGATLVFEVELLGITPAQK